MMNLQFDDFVALVVPTSAAFIIAFNSTALVQSLQTNILNPMISLIPCVQGNFNNSALTLEQAKYDENGILIQPALILQYGSFLTSLLTFMITIFIVYVFIVALYQVSRGKIDGTKKL